MNWFTGWRKTTWESWNYIKTDIFLFAENKQKDKLQHGYLEDWIALILWKSLFINRKLIIKNEEEGLSVYQTGLKNFLYTRLD